MKNFNPYKIVWSIEVKMDGRVKWEHYPSIDHLQRNLKASSGSLVYVITDKQFGLMRITFNGTVAETPAPFTKKIIAVNGNRISVIPLTEKQFNNPIYV